MTALYEPLYGGASGLGGFRCSVPTGLPQAPTCGKLTLTESGMKRHLKAVHGLDIQGTLPFRAAGLEEKLIDSRGNSAG